MSTYLARVSLLAGGGDNPIGEAIGLYDEEEQSMVVLYAAAAAVWDEAGILGSPIGLIEPETGSLQRIEDHESLPDDLIKALAQYQLTGTITGTPGYRSDFVKGA